MDYSSEWSDAKAKHRRVVGNRPRGIRVAPQVDDVCPNCHSQTDTFAGKSKARTTRKIVEVPEGKLVVALQSCKTIREALLAVGLVAS